MPDNPTRSLPNLITQEEYDRAKQELIQGRSFPKERDFDWFQDVVLPVSPTPPSFDVKRWRGITIELSSFIVGRPEPPNDENDEPVYLGQGSTPVGPKLIRYPAVAGEAPSVEKTQRKVIGLVAAYHSSLDREESVRVQTQAAAYEEDFDAIANDLLDAIESDAKSAAEFGLASAPGLSAFGLQTPGAAVKALTSLLPTFQSQQIGSDVRVLDSGRIDWYRSVDEKTWEARKITLHTTPMDAEDLEDLDENKKPAWYLAEWIITIGTEARTYEVASLLDPRVRLSSPDLGLRDAALLALARGEAVGTISDRLGLTSGEIAAAASRLADMGDREFASLATSAIATELTLLRGSAALSPAKVRNLKRA